MFALAARGASLVLSGRPRPSLEATDYDRLPDLVERGQRSYSDELVKTAQGAALQEAAMRIDVAPAKP